jgi:hypothetical protein
MTASAIALIRVFETVRVTQMSSRCVRYARNAVGARSRDHRAERSLVLGICFWPFIVRQHAPIVHPLLARPRPTPQPLPRERFRSLALFGHGSPSDLSPLCALKRTFTNASGAMGSRPKDCCRSYRQFYAAYLKRILDYPRRSRHTGRSTQ